MELTRDEKDYIIKMCYQRMGWIDEEIDKIENMPPNEKTYFINKKYNLISTKNKIFKIISKLEEK